MGFNSAFKGLNCLSPDPKFLLFFDTSIFIENEVNLTKLDSPLSSIPTLLRHSPTFLLLFFCPTVPRVVIYFTCQFPVFYIPFFQRVINLFVFTYFFQSQLHSSDRILVSEPRFIPTPPVSSSTKITSS